MSTEKLSPKLKALFDKAADLPRINVGVVCPETKDALEAAIEAAEAGIINPILIGATVEIKKIASKLKLDLDPYTIVDATLETAMTTAVKLVHEGKVNALMKGSLHSDDFMAGIVRGESGLRTKRRMSHCMVVDVPRYKKLLIITDAALNIAPTLAEKRDILQNAIDLAANMSIAKPKAALLSSVETINDKIAGNLDCAILCKMADRQQITGNAILDGPLAFDVAISAEAAATKKLISPVAGDADILLVPDLNAGNILFKTLDYLADAVSFGIVLGAKIPVILTSRAASIASRLGSCALARFCGQPKKNTD
jgi:phosphate acetyltransferase